MANVFKLVVLLARSKYSRYTLEGRPGMIRGPTMYLCSVFNGYLITGQALSGLCADPAMHSALVSDITVLDDGRMMMMFAVKNR